MEQAIRLGLDLAKTVIQTHDVDGREQTVVQRQLKRSQVLDVFAKPPLAPVTTATFATNET